MTIRRFLLLAAWAVSAAGPAVAHGDDHRPRHGGLFVAGKVADVEVVARPEAVQVYVYDHGKPAVLQGAKAKLTLLNGSTKTEHELVVAGDRLQAAGPLQVAKGTKGIASVTLAGKPAFNARFEVK